MVAFAEAEQGTVLLRCSAVAVGCLSVSESYAAEKLWVAVDMLAKEDMPIRGRLIFAFVGALVRLESDDFVDRRGPLQLRGDHVEGSQV